MLFTRALLQKQFQEMVALYTEFKFLYFLNWVDKKGDATGRTACDYYVSPSDCDEDLDLGLRIEKYYTQGINQDKEDYIIIKGFITF